MDYPEDELIARYERVTSVLVNMALDGDREAETLMGDSNLMEMKRNAIINIAVQPEGFMPKTMARAYPGIADLDAFVNRLRVQVAIKRLSDG